MDSVHLLKLKSVEMFCELSVTITKLNAVIFQSLYFEHAIEAIGAYSECIIVAAGTLTHHECALLSLMHPSVDLLSERMCCFSS